MNVGKLEKVELREVWKNEARDFTSWLYNNLEPLSDAINLTLLEPVQEKQVDGSRYSIDILAETEEGDGVIIENQLEQTNHKHLGQIITYLTNMDCTTAVWLAKEPRQEHVNAVNWLNEQTDKDFYLVKLEAFKIGDSEPAPFFSVICQPSSEVKVAGKEKKSLKEDRKVRKLRRDQCDTLIVPAQKEGFERVFLGENRWYAVRIRESRIAQLKWIAAYQVSPISSITHIAKIKDVVPYKDTGKYLINFEGAAEKVGPIPLGKNPNASPQGPVYGERDRIMSGKTVEEVLQYSKTKKAS